MKKNILTRTSALAMAALMIAAATGCNKQEEAVEVQAQAIKVAAHQPQRASLEQKASFTGKIMPDDSVSVYGKANGTVLKTYVELGETVKAGQLLFELDPDPYLIGYEQAKNAYTLGMAQNDKLDNGSAKIQTELFLKRAIESAQLAYEQQRDYFETAVDDDFDMTAFKKARKELRDAQKRYDTDPDGSVTVAGATKTNWQAYVDAEKKYEDTWKDYMQSKGDRVSFETAYDSYINAVEDYELYKSMQEGENDQEIEIKRKELELQLKSYEKTLADLKVYAPIDGVIEAKYVNANDQYALSGAGYVVSNKNIMVVNFSVSGDVLSEMAIGDEVIVENGNKTYNAEITEIGTMVDAKSGLFPVKARFTEQVDMLSGISVKLTAITAKGEDAVTIPVDSVYYDDGATYVYIFNNGVAERRDITVGIISEGIAEITDGLTESDTVITSWNANLKAGAAVEISEEV